MITVELEWEPPKPEEKIVRIVLYRRPIAAISKWTVLKEFPASQTKYVDSDSLVLQSYEYRLRAVNIDGKWSEKGEPYRVDPPAGAIPDVASKKIAAASPLPSQPGSSGGKNIKIELLSPKPGSEVTYDIKKQNRLECRFSVNSRANKVFVYAHLCDSTSTPIHNGLLFNEYVDTNTILDRSDVIQRELGRIVKFVKADTYSIYLMATLVEPKSVPNPIVSAAIARQDEGHDGPYGFARFTLKLVEQAEPRQTQSQKKIVRSEIERKVNDASIKLKFNIDHWKNSESDAGDLNHVVFWHNKKTVEYAKKVIEFMKIIEENIEDLYSLVLQHHLNRDMNLLDLRKKIKEVTMILNPLVLVWEGKTPDSYQMNAVMSVNHRNILAEIDEIHMLVEDIIDGTNEDR